MNKNKAETNPESLLIEREQQTMLLGVIPDAILAIDPEESPLFFNSKFALLFSDRSIENKKLNDLFHNPEILEAYRTALLQGIATSVKAIPFDQTTGKQFFSVSISPLRREKEEIYGAVGIFHDVTDLKRAEQIRIDFVANVSHELRTPLTAIKGYADTLIEDIEQSRAPQKEFLEVIARNTDRLMNLINDLLDISSLESTDILHKATISTEDLTQRVVSQMGGAFEAKNQTVDVEARAKLLFADPRRVEQVVTNLVDNASKYTPKGGKVHIAWVSEDKNDVYLKVSDSGPGIPPEHHSRLFERFYRVDKARSRELGGTGLGLAIVKHIMQRHEGSVWVESKPGSGSTFICKFPNE